MDKLKIKCGKGDLNPRTPMGLDSESSAFVQTWRFPRININISYLLFIVNLFYCLLNF